MDKILAEIYVPLLGTSWDVFISQNMKMYEVLELVKKAVADLSAGRFVPDDKTMLCYYENGSVVNINLSVAELDIRNGSKLMLI